MACVFHFRAEENVFVFDKKKGLLFSCGEGAIKASS